MKIEEHITGKPNAVTVQTQFRTLYLVKVLLKWEDMCSASVSFIALMIQV